MYVTTPDPDAIRFDDYDTPSGTPPGRLGESATLDNESNGGIRYLIANRANYSQIVQDNLLSTILNEEPGGSVAMYLDHYSIGPNSRRFRRSLILSEKSLLMRLGIRWASITPREAAKSSR